MLSAEQEKLIEEISKGATEGALLAAYWNLRDHADGYRETAIFQRRKKKWEDDRSEKNRCDYFIHEFHARGIEWAARDIAEMLGVPEHEIERPEKT